MKTIVKVLRRKCIIENSIPEMMALHTIPIEYFFNIQRLSVTFLKKCQDQNSSTTKYYAKQIRANKIKEIIFNELGIYGRNRIIDEYKFNLFMEWNTNNCA